MSECNDGISLDNPNSFWGEWFWAAHATRCDRIMIGWSNILHSYVVQQWTQGRLGESRTVPDHELEALQRAAMWGVEAQVCYAQLRCYGSICTLFGVLTWPRRKSSRETGYQLKAIRFSGLGELWLWMDQMRAVSQTVELETNTAPALSRASRRSARL